MVVHMTHMPIRADQLIAGGGQFNMPRSAISTTAVTLTSGVVCLTPFQAMRSETITKLRMRVITASATPTTALMGIYMIDRDGDFIKMSSIANTTALWASANSGTSQVTTSPSVALIANRWYATAAIWVGTTAPTVQGGGGGIFTTTNPANGPGAILPLNGALRLTGQTGLPNQIALSGITILNAQQAPYMEMWP